MVVCVKFWEHAGGSEYATLIRLYVVVKAKFPVGKTAEPVVPIGIV